MSEVAHGTNPLWGIIEDEDGTIRKNLKTNIKSEFFKAVWPCNLVSMRRVPILEEDIWSLRWTFKIVDNQNSLASENDRCEMLGVKFLYTDDAKVHCYHHWMVWPAEEVLPLAMSTGNGVLVTYNWNKYSWTKKLLKDWLICQVYER